MSFYIFYDGMKIAKVFQLKLWRGRVYYGVKKNVFNNKNYYKP